MKINQVFSLVEIDSLIEYHLEQNETHNNWKYLKLIWLFDR